MHKQLIVKVGFIALALLLGAGALTSSDLGASGYIVAIGMDGEAACEPGGESDCDGGNVT